MAIHEMETEIENETETETENEIGTTTAMSIVIGIESLKDLLFRLVPTSRKRNESIRTGRTRTSTDTSTRSTSLRRKTRRRTKIEAIIEGPPRK